MWGSPNTCGPSIVLHPQLVNTVPSIVHIFVDTLPPITQGHLDSRLEELQEAKILPFVLHDLVTLHFPPSSL